jgi:hypothetical protein
MKASVFTNVFFIFVTCENIILYRKWKAEDNAVMK